MIGMVADRKLILNELGDALAGPDLPPKAAGFGPFEQQGNQLPVLVRSQQGFGPRCRVIAQSFDAMQSRSLQPLTHRTLSDPQGVGDLLLGPTLLVQLPGPEAATFRPTSRWVVIRCVHRRRVQHIPAHDY